MKWYVLRFRILVALFFLWLLIFLTSWIFLTVRNFWNDFMDVLSQRFFNELEYERSCCITGALGGGKTRLGFDIALYYWRRGYRVAANVPHNFNDYMDLSRFPDNGQTLHKSFCILDEGGEYVRKAALASSITRSASKADYFTLFTGKRLPHKELQRIIVQPRFDFFHHYGIPVIMWLAKIVSADPKYKFVFFQVFPQVLHGTFSTLSSSSGLESFITRADYTVQWLAAHEGHQAGSQQEAGLEGFADDLASLPSEDA